LVGRFTHLGYDLYRFDREWINELAGRCQPRSPTRWQGRTSLALAHPACRPVGPGLGLSLAALPERRAGSTALILDLPPTNGEVTKMRDTTRARLPTGSTWSRPETFGRRFR